MLGTSLQCQQQQQQEKKQNFRTEDMAWCHYKNNFLTFCAHAPYAPMSPPQANMSCFVARERILCIQFQELKLTSREVASVLGNITTEVTWEKTAFEIHYYHQLQTNTKLKK